MKVSINKKITLIPIVCLWIIYSGLWAQSKGITTYHPIWNSTSENSAASMPLGGGDIGLNVWVESGSVLFYFSRSGTFDENNTFLKLGRVRVDLEPNPFLEPDVFHQELVLEEGFIKIKGEKRDLETEIKLWVDVFQPIIHTEITSNMAVEAIVSLESWRQEDLQVEGTANQANSYKWAPQGEVITAKDSIFFDQQSIRFFHRNKSNTVFDATVAQQGLEEYQNEMWNPLAHLTFGGHLSASGMEPHGIVRGTYLDTDYQGWRLRSISPGNRQHIRLYLHTQQTESHSDWEDNLGKLITSNAEKEVESWERTKAWWRDFWVRSFIYVDPEKVHPNDSVWSAGRNYQLFRYQLGCNAFGTYPTKFNGGLFTFDPGLVDSKLPFTPDFRKWGGGTFTAMNQRLVHFPMFKSGDFEMIKPQLEFYTRILPTAELRASVYWGHSGAVFSEQLENFGLPNPTEYGWNRPADHDPGLEYNAWLEYQWDTVLEFCLMMLELESYAGADITEYIPFIESCLRFFDEHYQYVASKRGVKSLDGQGHLILYPGTANETYKMAYNANSTISGLRIVTERLLRLPAGYLEEEQVAHWKGFLERIPPLSFRELEGHTLLAPAKLWERINNTESPQLYPVYPWGIYGIGQHDLEIAWNTWNHDPDVISFRSHIGWKQDNIFAARLGLTQEAADLTLKKMADGPHRFPTFWGPGFDWTPDHNWGGSGMIGMQEMLLQTVGRKIYLFPAWPEDWDVHFKLHAPFETVVEVELQNGKINRIIVSPASREKDIINLLGMEKEEKLGLYKTQTTDEN